MLSLHIAEALRRSPHRIVVTGASGWLGQATLDLLQDALGDQFHERVSCFGSTNRSLRLPDGATIEQHPLDELAALPHAPSLLLHYAFLTKDRAEQMVDEAYRAANHAISKTVIDALDAVGVDAAFVASSGAAAFAEDPDASTSMRLYGSLKRDEEEAFARWAQRHGASLAIARIHNLSGPHINKLESYALASFIVDALAGGQITVRAAHDVIRGYVSIRELISLAFALLLDDEPAVTRFDSGGDAVELGALAECVAAQFDHCPINRPARTPGEDRYLGDGAVYRMLLQRHGIECVPLEQQVSETAAWLSQAWPASPASRMIPHVER
jgi:nucleoside-diphosphate-sugar epimerase